MSGRRTRASRRQFTTVNNEITEESSGREVNSEESAKVDPEPDLCPVNPGSNEEQDLGNLGVAEGRKTRGRKRQINTLTKEIQEESSGREVNSEESAKVDQEVDLFPDLPESNVEECLENVGVTEWRKTRGRKRQITTVNSEITDDSSVAEVNSEESAKTDLKADLCPDLPVSNSEECGSEGGDDSSPCDKISGRKTRRKRQINTLNSEITEESFVTEVNSEEIGKVDPEVDLDLPVLNGQEDDGNGTKGVAEDKAICDIDMVLDSASGIFVPSEGDNGDCDGVIDIDTGSNDLESEKGVTSEGVEGQSDELPQPDDEADGDKLPPTYQILPKEVKIFLERLPEDLISTVRGRRTLVRRANCSSGSSSDDDFVSGYKSEKRSRKAPERFGVTEDLSDSEDGSEVKRVMRKREKKKVKQKDNSEDEFDDIKLLPTSDSENEKSSNSENNDGLPSTRKSRRKTKKRKKEIDSSASSDNSGNRKQKKKSKKKKRNESSDSGDFAANKKSKKKKRGGFLNDGDDFDDIVLPVFSDEDGNKSEMSIPSEPAEGDKSDREEGENPGDEGDTPKKTKYADESYNPDTSQVEKPEKPEKTKEHRQRRHRLEHILKRSELYSRKLTLGGETPKKTEEPKRKPGPLRPGKKGSRRTSRKIEDKVQEEAEEENEGSNIILRFASSPGYIQGEMREYQIRGLNWMVNCYENGINGILADEMGLGKTLQSISVLGYLKHVKDLSFHAIIVVPKSTLSNWQNEVKRWCPSLRFITLIGDLENRSRIIREELKHLKKWEVLITTYEMILKEKAVLRRIKWTYLILDEAHRIKNEEAQISKAVRQLRSRSRLLLTGTPLQNNLHELWALLNFLLPEVFSSSEDFDSWFDTADCLDSEELVKRLHTILKPFLLRRLKSEVEKNLPPKEELKVYVQLSRMQRKLYKDVLLNQLDTINAQGEVTRKGLSNLLMHLRKATNHPYLFDGLEEGPPFVSGDHLFTNSGKLLVLDKLLVRLKEEGSRCLIFTSMTKMMDILEDYCFLKKISYHRLDGHTEYAERQRMIDEFNSEGSETFLFMLSTRAGGLGINLASADVVILYDSDWNPQVDLQAMDRAHRIGQTKKVRVFRLIAQDTVDEKIVQRAAMKLKLDHMVIQQGRAVDKNAATNKGLSSAELMSWIKYETKVFLTESGVEDVSDETIDDILQRSKTKGDKLDEEIAALPENKLATFSLDTKGEMKDTFDFLGEDFRELRKKQKTAAGEIAVTAEVIDNSTRASKKKAMELIQKETEDRKRVFLPKVRPVLSGGINQGSSDDPAHAEEAWDDEFIEDGVKIFNVRGRVDVEDVDWDAGEGVISSDSDVEEVPADGAVQQGLSLPPPLLSKLPMTYVPLHLQNKRTNFPNGAEIGSAFQAALRKLQPKPDQDVEEIPAGGTAPLLPQLLSNLPKKYVPLQNQRTSFPNGAEIVSAFQAALRTTLQTNSPSTSTTGGQPTAVAAALQRLNILKKGGDLNMVQSTAAAGSSNSNPDRGKVLSDWREKMADKSKIVSYAPRNVVPTEVSVTMRKFRCIFLSSGNAFCGFCGTEIETEGKGWVPVMRHLDGHGQPPTGRWPAHFQRKILPAPSTSHDDAELLKYGTPLPGNQNFVICKICGSLMKSRAYLVLHLRIHGIVLNIPTAQGSPAKVPTLPVAPTPQVTITRRPGPASRTPPIPTAVSRRPGPASRTPPAPTTPPRRPGPASRTTPTRAIAPRQPHPESPPKWNVLSRLANPSDSEEDDDSNAAEIEFLEEDVPLTRSVIHKPAPVTAPNPPKAMRGISGRAPPTFVPQNVREEMKNYCQVLDNGNFFCEICKKELMTGKRWYKFLRHLRSHNMVTESEDGTPRIISAPVSRKYVPAAGKWVIPAPQPVITPRPQIAAPKLLQGKYIPVRQRRTMESKTPFAYTFKKLANNNHFCNICETELQTGGRWSKFLRHFKSLHKDYLKDLTGSEPSQGQGNGAAGGENGPSSSVKVPSEDEDSDDFGISPDKQSSPKDNDDSPDISDFEIDPLGNNDNEGSDFAIGPEEDEEVEMSLNEILLG